MAVPKRSPVPAPVAGQGHVVVVSRERMAEALALDWPALVALCEMNPGTTGIELRASPTTDGLVAMVRPPAGFASLRCGDSGMLKGRPILFEQGW